jgi:CIC family chloride channel protein
VAHAPIAGMLMVCDMAGTYALLPPLMIASILAIIFAGHRSIYRGQLKNKFQSPAHLWDMNLDVLETLTVRHFTRIAYDQFTISNTLSLLKAEEYAEQVDASAFILRNEANGYEGMLYLKRVHYTQRISFPDRAVAEFAMKIPAINPDGTLGRALQIMLEHNVETIAIVEGEAIAGCVSQHDIFHLYYRTRRRAF